MAASSKTLFLDPKKVSSLQSLRLALHLAQSSFKRKENIADKFHLEFLLWLAGKKDISSTLGEMAFKDSGDILIISFSGDCKKLLREINAIKKPLGIMKNAGPLELERISLSRV